MAASLPLSNSFKSSALLNWFGPEFGGMAGCEVTRPRYRHFSGQNTLPKGRHPLITFDELSSQTEQNLCTGKRGWWLGRWADLFAEPGDLSVR